MKLFTYDLLAFIMNLKYFSEKGLIIFLSFYKNTGYSTILTALDTCMNFFQFSHN